MSVTTHPSLRFNPPTEKDTQRAVVKLFRHAGCIVYSTSQYRASHIAVGFPDLFCRHLGMRLAFWWETKPPLARWRDRDKDPWTLYHPYKPETWRPRPLDPKQAEFRDAARTCLELYFWGDLRSAEDALVTLHLAVRADNGTLLLQPHGPTR